MENILKGIDAQRRIDDYKKVVDENGRFFPIIMSMPNCSCAELGSLVAQTGGDISMETGYQISIDGQETYLITTNSKVLARELLKLGSVWIDPSNELYALSLY